MLKALVLRYCLKDFDFLRKASSPKLEVLGISSLIPSEDELGKNGDATASSPPPESSSNQVGSLPLLPCHGRRRVRMPQGTERAYASK